MTINNNFTQRKINDFRFFKFIEANNYRQWKRNIQMTIISIQLYDLLDDTYKRLEQFIEKKWKKFNRNDKRDFEQNDIT